MIKIIIFKIIKENMYLMYLSRIELYNLLASNMKYYRSFTEQDKRARKIKTIQQYLSIISEDCSEFTEEEKIKVAKCAREANQLLSTFSTIGFDGKKAAQLEWKIGCMKGKRYEEGFPHTVKDVIILFKHIMKWPMKDLTRLLIHEKVHIYQRKYKKDVANFLDNHGFVYVYDKGYNARIRANPDTDGKVYFCKKTNKKYESVYNSDYPKSIEDIKNKNVVKEHPYEMMAYEIEKLKKV
jgi:hypothetical protein